MEKNTWSILCWIVASIIDVDAESIVRKEQRWYNCKKPKAVTYSNSTRTYDRYSRYIIRQRTLFSFIRKINNLSKYFL